MNVSSKSVQYSRRYRRITDCGILSNPATSIVDCANALLLAIMGMAQAFINRSASSVRRPLPPDTHRVARVLEANENLFVRRNEETKQRKPPYNTFVCCKPSYNRTHEPPWETDSPSKVSVTKRPMEDEMIKRDGPDRGGGRVTLS